LNDLSWDYRTCSCYTRSSDSRQCWKLVTAYRANGRQRDSPI